MFSFNNLHDSGGYQHLNDYWDLDHPFERMLVDTAVAPDPDAVDWINPRVQPGEERRVMTGIAGKTGVVYTLDRETGEFLWATPTITQNVISHIDGASGAVTENPELIFSGAGQQVLTGRPRLVRCGGPAERCGPGSVVLCGPGAGGATLCRSAPCWSSVARSTYKLLTSNALRQYTLPDGTSASRTAQASRTTSLHRESVRQFLEGASEKASSSKGQSGRARAEPASRASAPRSGVGAKRAPLTPASTRSRYLARRCRRLR